MRKIFEIGQDEIAFGVEYLPGQYDQRADSSFRVYNASY